MSDLTKGIIAMLISALGFTAMGYFLKIAGNLPVVEKAMFRNVIAALISGYFVWRNKTLFLGHASNRKTLLWRTAFGVIGIICNFYAIEHLILSDADIIMKTAPFSLILLSVIFLKERITQRQLLACVIAFIGLLFIIQPSFNASIIPYLIAVFAAICAAAAYLMLRVLALSTVKETHYTIVFFFSFASTILLLPILVFEFEPMSSHQFVYLVLSGIGATIGQFGITLAYQYAAAKEVSIYSYASVIFAAIISIVAFNDWPDLYSWIGYFIIFSSGYWMYRLNKKA